jgi:sugar/nucleoside kinase (ribokinase family)
MAERFTERLRRQAAGIWDAQSQHPFVRGIGDGTLELEKFKFWLLQDYVSQAIRELGPENVVVKGGHLPDVAADLLYDGCEFTEFRGERVDTKNTHRTGCIFASAIAATLAKGKTVRESTAAAKEFITAAIRASLEIGKGCGPANPMALFRHQARFDR